MPLVHLFFFFFNDTATTEIYTLSLHDALPISSFPGPRDGRFSDVEFPARKTRSARRRSGGRSRASQHDWRDRKSTRLNSSHLVISYAVFCLKKKTATAHIRTPSAARRAKVHHE